MKTIFPRGLSLPLALLLAFLFTNCKTAYQVPDFDQVTQDHRTVAILPFEMVFLGKTPKDLSEEDIREIEEAESQMFQSSFHSEVLRSAARMNRTYRVSLQPYATTTALLKKNGISIRESWTMEPEELAKLLEVDAVVSARVEKTRYMSDLTSYAIDAGAQVLREVTIGFPGPWVPNQLSKSKDIVASYTLIDTDGSQVLWSVSCDVDANWQSRSNDIIDRLNRLSARRFPYRQ